jgi:Beta/Gamma crystallin
MKNRTAKSVALFIALAVFGPGILRAFQFPRGRQMGGAGITVFRDENFRGQNATFRQDVPDLRSYGFNDRITSLRIAPGESWEVCRDTNYRGQCQVFSGDDRDLRRSGWTDKISSLRRVRGGGGGGFRPPSFSKVGIVLYDDPFFRGNSLPLEGPVDNLRSRNFHDRAESVRVISGRWEICAEPGFRRCQIVDRDVTQLSGLGMNKKLSSVRPVGYGSGGGNRPPYPEGRARLVLFDGERYLGRSYPLDEASALLSGFAGRARSLQVLSGTWLVCDGPRFTGRCEQVSNNVPDLDRFGLGGRIMSARPIDRY